MEGRPPQQLCELASACRDLFTQALRLNASVHGSNLEQRFALLFQQWRSKKPVMDMSDLSDEFEQYRVWARNLGVFGSDNSSLDFRLREAPEVKDGIASLLQDLKADLSESLFLLERDRDLHDDSSSEDSGCGSDLGNNALTGTNDPVPLVIKIAAYELQSRFNNISDIVRNLIKLAEVIRSSGARSRASRAAGYEHFEYGVNQSAVFEVDFLPLVLRHRFKVPETLVDRLARAISLRRRRFLYQAKHQKRLAYGVRKKPEPLPPELSTPQLHESFKAVEVGKTVDSHTSPSQVVSSRIDVQTAATTFRNDPLPRAPSTMVSASNKFDASGVELPPPPPLATIGSTHFECPYCCVLVAATKRQRKLWEQHLVKDLQPFMCIEPCCSTPDILLETRDDWLQHQLREHAMEFWCEGGDGPHGPQKFFTEEAFVAHLQQSHESSLPPGANIRGRVQIASHPSMEPFSCCPFCDYLPEALAASSIDNTNALVQAGVRQKALQDHIALELLKLFLLALPQRDDIQEGDSESKTNRILSTQSTLKPLENESLSEDGETLEFNDKHAEPSDPAFIDHLWTVVWTSPQLRNSVREQYEGLQNDPNLAHMLQHSEINAEGDEISDFLGDDAGANFGDRHLNLEDVDLQLAGIHFGAYFEPEFRKTIEGFKNRFSSEKLDSMKCESVSDLLAVLHRLEEQRREQRISANLNRLKLFIEAMKQFEHVLELFARIDELAILIWGPIKLQIPLVSKSSDAFDVLLDAYAEIGERFPLLQQYQSVFVLSPPLQKLLSLMFNDIIDFHIKVVEILTKPLWKDLFESLWRNNQARYEHLLDALSRHTQLLQREDPLAHIEQHQFTCGTVRAHLEQAESERHLVMQRDIMRWLPGGDSAVRHEAACETRAWDPSSSTWILSHPQMKEWADGTVPTNPILWLTGIPGAGKTVLASVVIEYCIGRQVATLSPAYITAYYYCTNLDSPNATCVGILGGLISQLLPSCPELVPYCHEQFLKSGDTGFTSLQLAKRLFEMILLFNTETCLIIDGLDEIIDGEREELLRFLTELVETTCKDATGKLRLLVVSRQEHDIRVLLKGASVLAIRPENIDEDIHRYVQHRMESVQSRFDLDAVEVEHVLTRACRQASGMFLFAKLMMDNLSCQVSKAEFIRELEQGEPKGLRVVYERIMTQNITRVHYPEAVWETVEKVLIWIACAKRPMRRHELQVLASIEPMEGEVTFDELKLREYNPDMCGPMVMELPSDTLVIAHSTARPFILAEADVNLFETEQQLTTLCLQYLMFPSFDSDIPDDELRKRAQDGQLAFYDYAVVNWPEHLLALAAAGAVSREKKQHVRSALLPPEDFTLDQDRPAFEKAVVDFALVHEKDVEEQSIDEDAAQACYAFDSYSSIDTIQRLWSLAKRYTEAPLEVRNKAPLPALQETLERGRKIMEELTTAQQGDAKASRELDRLYGTNRYKCPKARCYHFCVGFPDAGSRQAHVARHNRPFRCEVDYCDAPDVGFINSKALAKHVRKFHP